MEFIYLKQNYGMTINEINELCKNSLVGHLNIEFLEYSETHVKAKMPVDDKTRQPMGFLHGGASIALAETVASAGSVFTTDLEKYHVFGLQVSANHISTATGGTVIADALCIHKGKTTHVWEVEILDEEDKLISVARVTNIIIEKDKN